MKQKNNIWLIFMKKMYDTTDLEILRELRKNCKQPVRELAKKLHVHPNTLLQRIKKLEKEGIILRYHAEVDYSKLGYDMHAVILIRVRMGGDWESQIKNVGSIPQVMSLYAVTGGPDVIAIIKVRDKDDLAMVLRNIQKNKVVAKTTTMLLIYAYKSPYEFNPLEDDTLLKETAGLRHTG